MNTSTKPRTFEPLGPLQIKIMHLLWTVGTAHTVQQVMEAINVDKVTKGEPKLAYTTFLTVMRNLSRRGMMSQVADGRAHIFAPLITRDQYENQILHHLADTLFNGDLSNLIAAATRADITV